MMTAEKSYLVSDVWTLGLAHRVIKDLAKVESSKWLWTNEMIPQMI